MYRAGGHFDEEGNYIEDKAQKNDTDAWLEQAEVRRLGKAWEITIVFYVL